MRTRSRALIVGVVLVVLLLGVVLGDLWLRRGAAEPPANPPTASAPAQPAAVPPSAAPAATTQPAAAQPSPAPVSAPVAPPAPAPTRATAAAPSPRPQTGPAAAPSKPSAVVASPASAVRTPAAEAAAAPAAAASRQGMAASAPVQPPAAAAASETVVPAVASQHDPVAPVPAPPSARPAAASPAPTPAAKRPAPVLPGTRAAQVAPPAPVTPVRPCVPAAGERMGTIAVLPIENLSGVTVPAADVRQSLVTAVKSAGVRVLDDAALDTFMTRHHIRYAAGVDDATGLALKQEDGVDGVLVATMEFSNQTAPPKIALIARLISLKGAPAVAWADDVGMAGDDAPGLFALRQIDDYTKLQKQALDRIAGSLVSYLKTGKADASRGAASKFKPKVAYRNLTFQAGKTYTVAVVPFFNVSERRTAGDILSLLFMRHLAEVPQFCVVDPGVVRRQLLDARVIMDGGLSVTDAETVAAPVDADFVLSGRVMRYVDYEGPAGLARVEFSTVLIDKRSGKVVWSSQSDNDGRDGIGLFERGVSKTAHAMATQMVKLTTQTIAGRGR